MRDERHNHGYLHRRPIDAELHLTFPPGHKLREEDFVGRLVEDARDAEHQNGPRIAEHATQERFVQPPAHTEKFFPKSEGDEAGAGEVDGKDIVYLHHKILHNGRQNEEEEEIERDVEEDETEFEDGKLHRAFLIAKVAEGDGLKGIERYGRRHHPHVFRMVGIAHPAGNAAQPQQHQGDECQAHAAHSDEGSGVDASRVALVLAVDEAKQRGLHAESEDDEKQRGVGIDFRHHAISTGRSRDFGRVERHEQVVEKAPHDGTHSIDGGVFSKRF